MDRVRTRATGQTETMTAIVQDRYGAPEDVFEIRKVEKPTPDADEVLVRVHATPISGTDWHLTRGLPYVARPMTGLRKPRNRIPGYELAGTVEEVGIAVTNFTPGDEVFGWGSGPYAEFAAVSQGQLSRKPANLTLEQAAAVPISAFTAIQAVRDRGRVGVGQKVLITGASGGVGLYAVQFAKWLGAEVTGVSSAAKSDLVLAAGADHVIDYKSEDLTAKGDGYDVLIDIYGNPALRECRRVLRPGGILVMVGGTGGHWFMGTDRWLRAMVMAMFSKLKVRPLIHKDSHDDLVTIKGLIEEDTVKPILDKPYPLQRVAEAIQYVTDGHARGQVIAII